jgi:hypothetical protein
MSICGMRAFIPEQTLESSAAPVPRDGGGRSGQIPQTSSLMTWELRVSRCQSLHQCFFGHAIARMISARRKNIQDQTP